MAPSGAPADVFPRPERPVADIVSPIWHGEKERDAAGEPRQLVRLLGIKSGMTVAEGSDDTAFTGMSGGWSKVVQRIAAIAGEPG